MTAARRILVVDDHVALAENLAEILNESGYDTVVSESAEQALARLRDNGIAGVITDYRLPGKSGADLIVEMRRAGYGMPAVVMSAYTDAVTFETSTRAGALEVIAKPVNVVHLLDLVRRMAT